MAPTPIIATFTGFVFAIKFTPNCCNGFLWLVSAKRYFFSCIGQLWSQCISNDRLQKSIRLFTIKSFCRHKPCESHRNPKVFEKCSLYHGKRGQVAKYHHCKEWHDKPCHLRKGYGKRKSKIIDRIQYLFHRPDTGIASYFLHVINPFIKNRGSWLSHPVK